MLRIIAIHSMAPFQHFANAGSSDTLGMAKFQASRWRVTASGGPYVVAQLVGCAAAAAAGGGGGSLEATVAYCARQG